MPAFETRRFVRHSPEAMFDLVAKVEDYPLFIPFCEGLTVRARRREGGAEIIVADMTIGYKLLRERFTSKVTLDRPALTIGSDLVDGPFRTMTNTWAFEPTGDGCTVHFRISYEFKSRMLAALMSAMFDKVFRTFAQAFEKRADALYPAG